MAHESITTVLQGTIISTRTYKRDGVVGSIAIFQHKRGFYSAHWEQPRAGDGYMDICTKSVEEAQNQAGPALGLQAWHFTSQWTTI
jgi:hypothetical protein